MKHVLPAISSPTLAASSVLVKSALWLITPSTEQGVRLMLCTAHPLRKGFTLASISFTERWMEGWSPTMIWISQKCCNRPHSPASERCSHLPPDSRRTPCHNRCSGGRAQSPGCDCCQTFGPSPDDRRHRRDLLASCRQSKREIEARIEIQL